MRPPALVTTQPAHTCIGSGRTVLWAVWPPWPGLAATWTQEPGTTVARVTGMRPV